MWWDGALDALTDPHAVPVVAELVAAIEADHVGIGLRHARLRGERNGAGDAFVLAVEQKPEDRAHLYSPAAGASKTSNATGARPALFIPSSLAAARDRSMTRDWMNGPRSLMRTTTLF